MAKKGNRKKQSVQEQIENLATWQKVLIVGVISFIPFFFLLLLPLLSRDHFVKTLKLPEEVFLSSPEQINLVSTGIIPPTYKLNINGVEFKIPEAYTPSAIKHDSAEFSREPRKEARRIVVLAQAGSREIEFTHTGIARWFMPTSLHSFLQMILRANWHPVRLMFKAQFYASQGITSKIFETRWDAHHRGFIFPTSGQHGYLGRVFGTNKPGYFEFLYLDPVNPISLRDWVNLAMKIKPPGENTALPDPLSPSLANQATLSEMAEHVNKEPEVLGTALSEFYRTKQPGWLIPVAKVMENRQYFSELVVLHKQFLNAFPSDSSLRETWDTIFDRTSKKMLAIEIDPSLDLRELNVHCKNLTQLEIAQVRLRITIKSSSAGEQSFLTVLLPHGRLYESQEKQIIIKAPDHISLSDCEGIEYRITQIEFSQ